MSAPELHVISNGKQPLELFARIAGSIHPQVTAFHLREKTKSARELWQGIVYLREAGVPLHKIIINDRVDVAWAAGAGGVQLAYHSLEVNVIKSAFPGLRIGRSVHSPEEAAEMARQGADFLIYGHIFATSSKPGLQPAGLHGLELVTKSTAVPVIAIGGIIPDRVLSVIQAGAAGIAVMSGIVEAENPMEAVKRYRESLMMPEWESRRGERE